MPKGPMAPSRATKETTDLLLLKTVQAVTIAKVRHALWETAAPDGPRRRIHIPGTFSSNKMSARGDLPLA